MTYPDGIDALVNVNATDSLAAGGHAARHNSVNTALVEIKNMLGPSPAGKIMQVVRATDGTQRTTTSTSYNDVTGMSVTITPQKSDSALLLLAVYRVTLFANPTTTDLRGNTIITDSSNNAMVGAELARFGISEGNTNNSVIMNSGETLIAYTTPAGASAVTYKLRFRSASANALFIIDNSISTGQMYAIEVSA
jgi:hypothetical protein